MYVKRNGRYTPGAKSMNQNYCGNDPDRARLAASLTELAAAGSPVDISVAQVDAQPPDIEITQSGGMNDSTLIELPNGLTAYILDLQIVNQTSKTIYGVALPELRMLWDDPLFEFLPDPRETKRTISYLRKKRNGRFERFDAVSDSYYFTGGLQLEYPRADVLNHRLKHLVLSPGRPLCGLILATGSPMPVHLCHGQWIEPMLSITSSRHREHTAPVRLWIDRSQAKSKRARKLSLNAEPIDNVGSKDAVPGNPDIGQESEIVHAASETAH